MTLDEIRNVVADTTAAHWHRLSGEAPTYFDRFGSVQSRLEGEWFERADHVAEHELRAVLRSNVDIGLVWGMDAQTLEESPDAWWAPALPSGKRPAAPRVVEVLYRGQPVDRETYAVIDNANGLVPWPEPQPGDPEAQPEDLTVSRWQFQLALLLVALGAGVGSVEQYMRRCKITVID